MGRSGATGATGAVVVRAPATSANLGPAFDAAGLCLSLFDEVQVRATAAGLRVHVQGEGAGTLPRDERHLVLSSMLAAFDVLGSRPPGLEVACHNRIPQARGLGSSSAAIAAGLLAARALVPAGDEMLDDDALLALATRLEGHPDNVAACLRGGFTLAWRERDAVRVVRRDVHPDLLPVVFVPATQASTSHVRGLLPAQVPHVDAACSAGRAALLALAVTQDLGLLLAATEDRLHQQYRAAAMPGTAALVAALRAEGVAAVVSGAGPSVLALADRHAAAAAERLAPAGWSTLRLLVTTQGAQVRPIG